MRIFSLIGGVGALVFVPAGVASGATDASRARPFVARAQLRTPTLFRRASLPARGRFTTPTCATSIGFVGVPGEGDVAGGAQSAVLAGTSNDACDAVSGIGVGQDNGVGAEGTATSSFIAGGVSNGITGKNAFIGAGAANSVGGFYASIGAGYGNSADDDDDFIGAGSGNVASGPESFVGSGISNNAAGGGAFIGAGGTVSDVSPGNQIMASDSFIGAGDQNTIGANEAFVGSGIANTVGSAATYAAIVGGGKNTVSGEYAGVLDGYGNSAIAPYSIVIGGNGSTAAGELSLAAGYHADATHSGSFVWSDFSSGSETMKDTAVNQFVARASGGVYLYSNEAATSGVKLSPGSGTWARLSDRNAKTDIARLDDASILAKVASLPVNAWRYKAESGVRHLGPMAQDFYAAFGVGEDDRHITAIDEDGVALAAIKALHSENAELREDVDALRGELHRLESAVASSRKR